MSSVHSKVSRSYRNKKISDMVADIYYDYLDYGRVLNVEPTERTETLIIPNLKPISECFVFPETKLLIILYLSLMD